MPVKSSYEKFVETGIIIDWSRTRGHFFALATFKELETDVKNCRCYYKKTNQQQLNMVCTAIEMTSKCLFVWKIRVWETQEYFRGFANVHSIKNK